MWSTFRVALRTASSSWTYPLLQRWVHQQLNFDASADHRRTLSDLAALANLSEGLVAARTRGEMHSDINHRADQHDAWRRSGES